MEPESNPQIFVLRSHPAFITSCLSVNNKRLSKEVFHFLPFPLFSRLQHRNNIVVSAEHLTVEPVLKNKELSNDFGTLGLKTKWRVSLESTININYCLKFKFFTEAKFNKDPVGDSHCHLVKTLSVWLGIKPPKLILNYKSQVHFQLLTATDASNEVRWL